MPQSAHQSMQAPYDSIIAVLQDYFDGLYHSDTTRLRRVFHANATYACATQAPLVHMDMPTYFALVDKRPSPASKSEKRRDRIAAIEFAGPVTAFARVECAIGPRFCTDFLTFVHVDHRWQVIAKVFHYDLTA